MFYENARKRIGSTLILQAGKIHPSLCATRNESSRLFSKVELDFVQAFLLHCSDEELKRLWELADYINSSEVILIFYQKRSTGETSCLSGDEMKSFDFTNCSWEARPTKQWDELTEIFEHCINICFM